MTFSEKETIAVAATAGIVKFSASEFAKMNKGLIRLLKYVRESGTAGVATRKACEDIFNYRTYGMQVIKRAERLGYIKREKEPPTGQGNWMMINRLTANGKKLLDQLKDQNSNNNNISRSATSSNRNDTRLKVSHSDFLRKKDNAAGLIRLLRIIEKAGKNGISTRKLCEQAFNTRNYGMRVINRAYDEAT